VKSGLLAVACALTLCACGSPPHEDRVSSSIRGTEPVPEPKPYHVEETANGEVDRAVAPGTVRPPQGGERSIAWQLDRVFAAGRKVQISPGCGSAAFQESTDAVLVQVVETTEPCTSFFVLTLDAPLGDRTLLHAPTSLREDTRSLAERFSPSEPWPGQPWYRAGKEVLPREVSLSAGPEHCGWERATFLGAEELPAPKDARGRLWVRDPEGALDHFPGAKAGFMARATLPPDAEFTGYESGHLELWTAPSDFPEHIYVVNDLDPTDVERWVRGGGGCA
jgi:hypothetical protein